MIALSLIHGSMDRNFLWLFLITLLIAPNITYGFNAAKPQDRVELSGNAVRYSLSEHITYLEDASHTLTLENAIEKYKKGEFIGGQKKALNFGFTTSAYWFHITLKNNNAEYQHWILEQWYQLLDQFEVFVQYPDGVTKSYITGDSIVFSSRAIQHFRPNIALDLASGEEVDIYMRAISKGSFQVPLNLWEREAFLQNAQKELSIFSIYYGVIVAMLFYNLLLYISIRDINYLYYVSYLGSYLIFQLVLNGLAYQLLWPENPWLNSRALAIMMCVGISPILLFSRSFLKTAEYLPKVDLVFKWSLAFFALVCVSVFFFWGNTIALIATLASLSVSVVAFIAGILCWAKGYKPAFYYVVSWIALILGMITYVGKGVGVLPVNYFTEYAIQIGSAMEMILLSIALADRINQERSERLKAQEYALKIEKKSTELLEVKVKERTAELEEAKRKYQELSTTDQLTGLRNRRSFDEVITKEFYRCARYERYLSLLMIDIDFFKRLNDEHGHLAGDECLKNVAACINGSVRRPSDHCARYGGEEFSVVLPETDLAGARKTAARILSSVAGPTLNFDDKKIKVTVSIGLVYGIPSADDSPELLIRRADEALYNAKKAGRNRIEVLSAMSPLKKHA